MTTDSTFAAMATPAAAPLLLSWPASAGVAAGVAATAPPELQLAAALLGALAGRLASAARLWDDTRPRRSVVVIVGLWVQSVAVGLLGAPALLAVAPHVPALLPVASIPAPVLAGGLAFGAEGLIWLAGVARSALGRIIDRKSGEV
jgi:hypothetical protein